MAEKSVSPAVKQQAAPPAHGEPVQAGAQAQSLLALQKAAGNRAVGLALSGAGEAPTRRRAIFYQAKSAVSQPGDRFEREADLAAEAALKQDAECWLDQSQDTLASGSLSPVSGHPGSSSNVSELRSELGSGQPLPENIQTELGSRFRQNFNQVRVHTGQQAGEAANDLQANALTVGSDIVFAPGKYAPETVAGKRLLAHELSHVLQQNASTRSNEHTHNRATAGFSPVAHGTIQRDDVGVHGPGSSYEFSLERKGERYGFKLTFAFSRKSKSKEPVKIQLGAAKIARTKSAGQKAGNSMSLALLKTDLSIAELMPGVTVKADIKALEGKLEKKDTGLDLDVNILKVAVAIEGDLTKAIAGTDLGDQILSTEFGELIKEGFSIKIKGQVEVSIDPYDAVRLARMLKLNRQIAEETAAAVKAEKKLKALADENRNIRNSLKKRGAKLKPQQRKVLQQRMKRNGAKIKKLTPALKSKIARTKLLQKTYTETAKGLKTKAGRLVGAVVKKVGGKLLMKLIPFVNVLSLVKDIYDAGKAIYGLLTGKAKFGLGGGEEGQGEADAGAAGEPGAEPGTEAGVSEPGDAGAGTGGSTGAGGEDAGEGELKLGPEIDISDEVGAGGGAGKSAAPDAGAAGDAGAKPGRVVQLHPDAQAVFDAIRSGPAGKQLSPEDLDLLNNLIPKDMSAEEKKALIDALTKGGLPKADPLDTLGAILERVRAAKARPPVTKVIEDGKEEILPEPTGKPAEGKQQAQPGATGKAEGAGKPSKAKKEDTSGEGKEPGSAESKKKQGGGGPLPGEGKEKSAKRKRKQRSQGGAEKLKTIPLADVPPTYTPTSELGFEVVSGYNPGHVYKNGDVIPLTVNFSHDRKKYQVKFNVVVQSRTDDGEKIVVEATNQTGWENDDAEIYMRTGDPFTLTSMRKSQKKN